MHDNQTNRKVYVLFRVSNRIRTSELTRCPTTSQDRHSSVQDRKHDVRVIENWQCSGGVARIDVATDLES